MLLIRFSLDFSNSEEEIKRTLKRMQQVITMLVDN